MNRRHFHFGIFTGLALLTRKLFGRQEEEVVDLREHALRIFFLGRPAWKYSQVFVNAADWHSLDWRLLPAICFVETGGGKQVRHQNNWFGWRSGKAKFPTVEAAIGTVAAALDLGVRYRGKSTSAKLRVYNPLHGYSQKVWHVMRLLSDVHEELNVT